MQDAPRFLPAVRAGGLVAVGDDGRGRLVYDGSPAEVMRGRIDALTREMLQSRDQIELHVEHTVEDGMYMRKLYIPKGALVAGKIHLKSCLNIVASGEISVLTETGFLRLKAGFTGVSHPGIQKVGLADEDTVFINVFRTDETDLDAIEAEVATTEHPRAIAHEEGLPCR